MKKILCISIIMAMLCAGCGYSESSSEPRKPRESITSEQSEQSEPETESKTEPETEVVDSVEIFNNGDFVITYKGIMETEYYSEILLLIENNTELNYMIQARDFSANGFMVDKLFSEDIAAGKKCNTSIKVPVTELQKNGIDLITEAEFSFHIFQSDEWSNFIDTDMITISAE